MCLAIRLEISGRASEWQDKKIRSIYFGGGTPGLLPIQELNSFFLLFSKFGWTEQAKEITLEVNPENVRKDTIEAWNRLGISRISLGIQSMDDAELKWMRRTHNARRSAEALDLLTCNFKGTLSVDLIFGTPFLNPDKLEKQLNFLIQYHIPHISCYQLTVEHQTLLEKEISDKKMVLPPDEDTAEQFLFIHKYLTNNGYEHYEISNYALNGYRAIHNSLYWERHSYSGFGPSAHSFDGYRKRRKNIAVNHAYMRKLKTNEIYYEEEYLDDRSFFNDYILTRLRISEGINFVEMKKIFHEDKTELLQTRIKTLPENWFHVTSNSVALTPEGMLYADYILRHLFD